MLVSAETRWMRLARVGAVEVRADPTWWAMLVISGLPLGAIGHAVLGLSAGRSIAFGAGFSLALAVSILVHEGGHALVGSRLGLQPIAIQGLWLGGATVYRRQAGSPSAKALSAAAGPGASILMAAVIAALAFAQPDLIIRLAALGFAGLNLGYALLNLVPAYPQDGGHLLQALLWWLLGDESRALRVAGQIGLVLAAAVMVAGVVVGTHTFLFSGILLAGQSVFLALASAKAITLA